MLHGFPFLYCKDVLLCIQIIVKVTFAKIRKTFYITKEQKKKYHEKLINCCKHTKNVLKRQR